MEAPVRAKFGIVMASSVVQAFQMISRCTARVPSLVQVPRSPGADNPAPETSLTMRSKIVQLGLLHSPDGRSGVTACRPTDSA
jgi:hypothetical protein